MTKNEIITALFLSKDFDDCINSRCPPHLKEDFKAEIALILCEKKESLLVDLYQRNQLKFFVVRIMLNQLGNNGPFYKKHRMIINIAPFDSQTSNEIDRTSETYFDSIFSKEQLSERDEQYIDRLQKEEFEDVLIAKVRAEIDNLHWYKAGLLNLYLKLGSFRAVAKQTRIPVMSIHSVVKPGLKEIRDSLCRK